MHAWAWVFLGGALGGVLRYGVTWLATQRWGTGFPWGTAVVNLSGACLLGIWVGAHYPLAALHTATAPGGLLLSVGVLGSYTTVSSFSLQTFNLWQAQRYWKAALNSALTVIGCPLLFALGYSGASSLT